MQYLDRFLANEKKTLAFYSNTFYAFSFITTLKLIFDIHIFVRLSEKIEWRYNRLGQS